MTKFQALPGVEDVHDLHIWSISSNSISLTCHIRVSDDAVLFVCAERRCAHVPPHPAQLCL